MDTLEKLENIIQPLLDDLQVELVDLQFNKGTRTSVRVFVWEDGGINLDRCSAISRQIADIIERKDIISEKFFLEVSSPGLDRSLKVKRDFERQIGRKVKAVIQIDDKTKQIKGKIESVDEDGVSIKTKQGVEITPYSEIVSAKVMVEF